MSTLFTLAGQIAGAWATATALAPLLAIPAAVWGIRTAFEIADRLAAAARFTYRAGRVCGRVWFTYGLPALLQIADAISWAIAQVDWQEVAAIVRQGLIVIAAAVITAGQLAIPTLERLSAALGRRYAALLVPAEPAAPAPAPGPAAVALEVREPEPAARALPAITLADLAALAAAALEPLPVAELRRLARAAGLPRSITRTGRRAALLPLLAGLEVAMA